MGYIDSIRGRLGGRWSVLKEVWSHPINRGSRLLALRDYALWNAVRFSMDARHVVRLPEGLEIILGKKENYGSVVYTHFLSDYAELLFLAHCLRSGDLFADVGANVGLYSVWVGGSTGARVVAFEPNPTTFLALNQNIRLNDLGALIEAHQFAIGDVSGSVALFGILRTTSRQSHFPLESISSPKTGLNRRSFHEASRLVSRISSRQSSNFRRISTTER